MYLFKNSGQFFCGFPPQALALAPSGSSYVTRSSVPCDFLSAGTWIWRLDLIQFCRASILKAQNKNAACWGMGVCVCMCVCTPMCTHTCAYMPMSYSLSPSTNTQKPLLSNGHQLLSRLQHCVKATCRRVGKELIESVTFSNPVPWMLPQRSLPQCGQNSF